MKLRSEILKGQALAKAIPDLACLRIGVFAAWPYLYDGDLEYEANYLKTYEKSAGAIVVAIYDQERMVGCATGTLMEDHADEFAQGLKAANLDARDVFYCAESVLLPKYRGLGVGHLFFDEREAHAREMGRKVSVFCSVLRDEDDPRRPAVYRPLNGFWQKRGYAPISGGISRFPWKEPDEDAEIMHEMQLWMKKL